MRLRTYDPDGKPIWGPNTPASTGSSRLGGELVVGGPGSVDLARIAHRKMKDREAALRGEKLAEREVAKSARFVAGKDAA